MNFSAETMQARRNIIQSTGKKTKQKPANQGYYIHQNCIRNDVEIFPDKQMLKELMTTRLVLQEILK